MVYKSASTSALYHDTTKLSRDGLAILKPSQISFYCLTVFHITAVFIKRRIVGVKILAVEVVLSDSQGIAEALIMHDLPLAKELNGVAYVGIVRQAQNVVVGGACFLLCYYHVFARFLGCQKTRKILIFQGVSVLLKLTIFQKFQ